MINKMINKIIEIFYPFTNDINKFTLKNESSWFSNKYRNILYSGNGGKTFKKLLRARSPLFTHSNCILEYNWSFEDETFDCEDESFSKYKDKFKCLDDINKYIDAQYEIYLNGKKDVEIKRKNYLNKLNENIQ